MTLTQLLADCYRRLGYASSPDTAVTTRLTAFLNETQRDILSEPGMQALLNETVTFASVASTPQYSLPAAVSTIKNIFEITNDLALGRIHQDVYRKYDPDTTANTGTPTHYVDLGFSAVDTQPSDASTLYVKSSDATDTTQVVDIEGFNSSGNGTLLHQNVTLNGTTAVAFGGGYTHITKFYVSASTAGIVTLHEDSGSGTQLAQLYPSSLGNALYNRRRRIALWPCPSTAITYYVDCEFDIFDMSDATDEPMLPIRFHPMLAIGARMKEYEKQSDSRYALAAAEYQRRLAQLKFHLFSGMYGTRPSRPSRLGPYYPAV